MLRLLELLVLFGKLVYNCCGVPGLVGLAVLLGGAMWVLYRYGGELFFGLVFRNLAAHGKVLRNADVKVHSLTPAPEPAKDEEDLEFERELDAAGVPDDDTDCRYFYLEVTITPAPGPDDRPSRLEAWHPSSLLLTKAGRKNVELMEVCDAAFIVDGWVAHGQELTPFTKQPCYGAARLKLHLMVRADCRWVSFLYMKEVFGDIALPALPAPVPSAMA
jgi:hypothetical protein